MFQKFSLNQYLANIYGDVEMKINNVISNARLFKKELELIQSAR